VHLGLAFEDLLPELRGGSGEAGAELGGADSRGEVRAVRPMPKRAMIFSYWT
jgi:hypothetical protein